MYGNSHLNCFGRPLSVCLPVSLSLILNLISVLELLLNLDKENTLLQCFCIHQLPPPTIGVCACGSYDLTSSFNSLVFYKLTSTHSHTLQMWRARKAPISTSTKFSTILTCMISEDHTHYVTKPLS